MRSSWGPPTYVDHFRSPNGPSAATKPSDCPPPLADCTAREIGSPPPVMLPATYVDPAASTARPFTASLSVPPRYVAKTSDAPAGSTFATNASPHVSGAKPGVHCGCAARIVGRSVDLVRPAPTAAPVRSTATVVPWSHPVPPRYVAYATSPRRVILSRKASGHGKLFGGPFS